MCFCTRVPPPNIFLFPFPLLSLSSYPPSLCFNNGYVAAAALKNTWEGISGHANVWSKCWCPHPQKNSSCWLSTMLCTRCTLKWLQYVSRVTPDCLYIISADLHTYSHEHTLTFAVLYGAPPLHPIYTTLLADFDSAAKSSSVGQQRHSLPMTFTCTCYPRTQTHTCKHRVEEHGSA